MFTIAFQAPGTLETQEKSQTRAKILVFREEIRKIDLREAFKKKF